MVLTRPPCDPTSIDDTATPPTTVEQDRGGDFAAVEVPIGRDITQVPDPADDAEAAEQDAQPATTTLEELVASAAAAVEPTENEPSENESIRVRQPTRSEPVDATPAPPRSVVAHRRSRVTVGRCFLDVAQRDTSAESGCHERMPEAVR